MIEIIEMVEKHNTLITINYQTTDNTKRRCGTRGGRGRCTGNGGERTRCHHPVPAGKWATGWGRKGGGAGVLMVEAGRERKGHLDGITPGTTWDWLRRLRKAKFWQPGKGRQIQTRARNSFDWPSGSKAQTSGEIQQAGAPFRWKVAPRPGEMGGEKRVQY